MVGLEILLPSIAAIVGTLATVVGVLYRALKQSYDARLSEQRENYEARLKDKDDRIDDLLRLFERTAIATETATEVGHKAVEIVKRGRLER